LTANALQGIRKMPAHGGNMQVSDIEVERAIVNMVNRSGGNWIEPLGAATPAQLRTSEQIVQSVCSKCHKDGTGGAPKIGDRAAWTPRVSKGLDKLVKSAVHGHGAMPARGGVSDLSDVELQGAIVYMFNYGIPMAQTPPPAPAPANPYYKLIDGSDVYLGVVRAQAMAAGQPKGSVPSGKDYYHVNISLFDAKSKLPITDAQVKVKVADSFSTDTRTLEVISANNTISYGAYFRMSGTNRYAITAQIQRPGAGAAIEVKFEYKPR
jgi:cytochrome c5